MAIQGVFASDANIVGNRKGDFASMLLKIFPDGNAPLLALSSGMQSQDASDTIITWFEENHMSGRAKVTALETDGDGVTFTFDDVSNYVPGTVLLNERTGEYVLVTAATPSNNKATVTRNMTGAGAVTVQVNDYFQRVGTAFEEGSSRPTAVANLGYPRMNYTQIFRNAWDVTGTAKVMQYYTGDVVAKNIADCSQLHAEDIERSLLWGKKTVGVLNSKPFRTMDGLYNQIVTNVSAAGGTTTYAQMMTFWQTVFAKNIKGKPNERIAFTGNQGVRVFNDIAKLNGQMQFAPGVTEFGFNIYKWITPFGNVTLKTHPLFTESAFRTGDLLVMHPGAFATRYLRRTNIDNYDSNGDRAGVDADFGVYTTEMSCQYQAEITGAIKTGLTAAA